MLKIIPVTLDKLEPYLPDAEKLHILFPKSAIYFAAMISQDLIGWELVGFGGIQMNAKMPELKSAYIRPLYRKKGYYKALIDERIKYVQSKGRKKVTATCTEASLPHWIKMGAVVTKEFKLFKKVELKLQ